MATPAGSESHSAVPYVQQLKNLWQKEAADSSLLRDQVTSLQHQLQRVRTEAPSRMQQEMLDFYETFDVYSEFADLPELIPRWISRMWFDAAHVIFIFNTSSDNPMLASSFSNAVEFSDSSDEFEEFTNRLLRIQKPIRCTVNSVPAYIANYIGVAIAEMVLYPLAQSDGPAVFAVLNPIAVHDTSQHMIETEKALHHAMRSIRLSVEHALEQERYERQLKAQKDMGELYRQLANIYEATFNEDANAVISRLGAEFEGLVDNVFASVALADSGHQTIHTTHGVYNLRKKDSLSTRTIRSGRTTYCTNRHNVLRDPEIESPQAQQTDSILVVPFALQQSLASQTAVQQPNHGYTVMVRPEIEANGTSNPATFGVVIFCRTRGTFAQEEISALEQIAGRVSPGLHRWWSSKTRDMLRPATQVRVDVVNQIHTIQQRIDQNGWEALAEAKLQASVIELLDLKAVHVLIVSPDQSVFDMRDRGTKLQLQASSTRNLVTCGTVCHGSFGSQSEPWLKYHTSHLEAEVVLHAVSIPWSAAARKSTGQRMTGVILGITEKGFRNHDMATITHLHNIIQTSLRPSIADEVDILEGELAAQQEALGQFRQELNESNIVRRFASNAQMVQTVGDLTTALCKAIQELLPSCAECKLAVSDALFERFWIWQPDGSPQQTTDKPWRVEALPWSTVCLPTTADVANVLKKQSQNDTKCLPITKIQHLNHSWQCCLLIEAAANPLLQKCDRLHEVVAVTQHAFFRLLHIADKLIPTWQPQISTAAIDSHVTRELAKSAAAYVPQVSNRFNALVLEIFGNEVMVVGERQRSGAIQPGWLNIDTDLQAVTVPYKAQMTLQAHSQVPAFHPDAIVLRVGSSPYRILVTSAESLFATAFELIALRQLADQLTERSHSARQLETAISQCDRQDQIMQNFPRFRDHSSLESVLVVALEEFGRLCEFETTALYVWRKQEQYFQLVAGGMHPWCKLHEMIRPGDGIMSKLALEDAPHSTRVTKAEFAVFVPAGCHLPKDAPAGTAENHSCLIVGIRDNDAPLCDYERRLLTSFKHWLTVISREYTAMHESQNTQQQISGEQEAELSRMLAYYDEILNDWHALSHTRQRLLEIKSGMLSQQEVEESWESMIVTGLRHIMDNVPERFEISLLDDEMEETRARVRSSASSPWVQQMIKQGPIHHGYIKVQRLDAFMLVGEQTLRQQDEQLAAEVQEMIEELLAFERFFQLQAASMQQLSADLETLQTDTAFRPAETLAALCQIASQLFRDDANKGKLELPNPHPPKAHEMLTLLVFAHSLVNEMIPSLRSDSGIRGLLDIVERAVPTVLCDCVSFDIHWPSATPHRAVSSLAAGMVAHVQNLGQPMNVTDAQAKTTVLFSPVHYKGQVLAVLEIGQKQSESAENEQRLGVTLDTVRECVSCLIQKIASSWQNSPTLPRRRRSAHQAWAKTFKTLNDTASAESVGSMLRQGAFVALELFGAAATAVLLPDGLSFKGEVCIPDVDHNLPAKDVARIAASFLPQDTTKHTVLDLEEPMLTLQQAKPISMFLALFPIACRTSVGWLALERSTPFHEDEVACAEQFSQLLSKLSRTVEERVILERHTAELTEVRKLAAQIETSTRFGVHLRELTLQADLATAIQAMYSTVPNMMNAEAVRLHIRLCGEYVTNPFTAEEQRMERLRPSITATCFQTGKVAVFSTASAAEQYFSTFDRVPGFEGLACAFIPLKAPNNAVIAVLVAAFSDDIPIDTLPQHDNLQSRPGSETAVRLIFDTALHVACCLARHVEYHELQSAHKHDAAALHKITAICSRPWTLLEELMSSGQCTERKVAVTLGVMICNAIAESDIIDVILRNFSSADVSSRAPLFGYSVTRNDVGGGGPMEVDSVLQEQRFVEQVYRDDDELLQRCRSDGRIMLNGLDASQFGVLIHLRNLAGEELGFIRATFRHGNSQGSALVDVLQLFGMFASVVIQHATSGPYDQLALPSAYRAKYVKVLMDLMLATHHDFDTPAELCEIAEQSLRQLPGVASAQLLFEIKPSLDTLDDSDKQEEETVYALSPSPRSLKSRASSRLFFTGADGMPSTKRPESARALKYVWDSFPYRATLTVQRTTQPTESDQELFAVVPKLIGSTAVRVTELTKLKLEISNLNRQVTTSHGVLSAKDAEVRTLEATKSRCEQEWLSTKDQLDKQVRRTLNAEEELAKLRAEAGQLMNMSPAQVMRRLERASSSVQHLSAEKDQLTLKLTALQEALEQLKEKLATTREKLATSEGARQRLEVSRKALLEKEQLLSESIRSAGAEKQLVLDELARAKSKEKKLLKAMREKEAQVSELEATCRRLEAQSESERARADDLQDRIEEIRRRQTQMGARWKQLMDTQSPGPYPTGPTSV